MSTPDPREEKLPRWAQDALRRLRRELTATRRDLDQAKGADPRPPLAVRDQWGERLPVAWDQHDSITFLPGYPHEDSTISARVIDGEVELMASSGLSLRPQVSNVVRVRVTRR